MAKIKKTKIEDLIPDDLNFNKGTQFGQSMIEKACAHSARGVQFCSTKTTRL